MRLQLTNVWNSLRRDAWNNSHIDIGSAAEGADAPVEPRRGVTGDGFLAEHRLMWQRFMSRDSESNQAGFYREWMSWFSPGPLTPQWGGGTALTQELWQLNNQVWFYWDVWTGICNFLLLYLWPHDVFIWKARVWGHTYVSITTCVFITSHPCFYKVEHSALICWFTLLGSYMF